MLKRDCDYFRMGGQRRLRFEGCERGSYMIIRAIVFHTQRTEFQTKERASAE